MRSGSPSDSEQPMELQDLTPKPLRIAKRGGIQPLNAFMTDHSRSLSTSQPHQSLIPHRRSSVLSENTQLDLSQRDQAAATSPWSRRHTYLNVRKQRQSDTLTATSLGAPIAVKAVAETTKSYPDSQPPRLCTPRTSENVKRAEGSTNLACYQPNATNVRSFRSMAFNKSEALEPLDDESRIDRGSTYLVGGRRRAVTVDEGLNGHAEIERGVQRHHLRRQPSFKQRLISRVMSGLSSKTSLSHSVADDGRQDELTSQDSILVTQSSEHADNARISVSSSGTGTYSGSDLDNALAVFPSPPKSTFTSPTTDRSFESSRMHSQDFRSLCHPENVSVLGAELSITPEYDQLNPVPDQTILVAIEVKATLHASTGHREVLSQHNGLDIAVVIDNSLYNSPATLMASCEITRFLGTLVDVTTDRLAIICSSPSDDSKVEPNILVPLGHVKTQKLKTVLDGVSNSSVDSRPGTLAEAIKCAQDLLVRSPVPNGDSGPLQDIFGHIIVLTADTSELTSGVLVHEKVQTHLICPGVIPRQHWESIECSGWKLRSMTAQQPQAVSSKKDSDPYSLFNRLRDLIQRARGGNLHGTLTDMVLDVEPGPDCTVEDVFGRSDYLALRPGEMRTIIVKVKTSIPTARGYSLTPSPQSVSPRVADDVLSELDNMLGVSAKTILTAKLKYKHSLLPTNTNCSTVVDCQMKMQTRTSASRRIPRKPIASQNTTQKSHVHQRLAYYFATCYSPCDALLTLRNEFGDGDSRSACPEYISLLTKELKYQARIAERLAIQDSPQKIVNPTRIHSPGSSYRDSVRGPFQYENHKPQNWITVLPDEEAAEENIRLNIKEALGLDDARRIWNDLKKISGSGSNSGGSRVVGSRAQDERTRNIRELALRNKRSIGEETMRSFASPARIPRTGFGAPWL